MGDLEARIDALEEAGRYDDAAELLETAQSETGVDQRLHIAWMRTRAGRDQEAAELWRTLRAERPEDPGVPYLEGAALLEADRPADALAPLEQALAMGLEIGSDVTVMRRIADDRAAAMRAAGASPTEVDRAARDALSRSAVGAPWFDAGEYPRAVAAWPAFAQETGDAPHAAYSLALDRRMRGTSRRPVLVALTVDEVQAWADEHGWEAGWGVTHDQVAAEAARAGRGRPWPPGRNERCWCGSGAKYKRCCGA